MYTLTLKKYQAITMSSLSRQSTCLIFNVHFKFRSTTGSSGVVSFASSHFQGSMSQELHTSSHRELVETLHFSLINNDDVTRRNDNSHPKVSTTNCGTVDEICTCVGFLTCQDPENSEIDDDIIEVLSPSSRNIPLPDPPQPDPPESHTVLVQRTRNNEDECCAESTMFDDGTSSRAPIESFDVIVHSPSRQQQYNDDCIFSYNDDEHYSTVTATTTSTARRKKPEEYEPLLLIVDDDELGDHAPQISPTSNCAIRDTSSTSSLQYHRRSPMFLSYASPQQERTDRDKESKYNTTTTSHRKQRHYMFQSLVQDEISKRNGRIANTTYSSSRPNAYSIQYNRYSTSKNHHRAMEDTIRQNSNVMHHTSSIKNDTLDDVDQYRYPERRTSHRIKNHSIPSPCPDTSTIATSTLASELDHHPLSYTRTSTAEHKTSMKKEMNDDTDTVRAVAPDKMILRIHDNDPEDDDDDDERDERCSVSNNSNRFSHHFIPTDQVIVVVPHSNLTKWS